MFTLRDIKQGIGDYMKTKFTKGEWSIFGDWGICKNGRETELIATFEPRGVGQKEGFANAHLIASAPEMYEMLERQSKLMGFLDAQTHANIELDAVKRAIDKLLAKARGEHE